MVIRRNVPSRRRCAHWHIYDGPDMQAYSADGDYALSLERIFPFPPDAQEPTLDEGSRSRGCPHERADNIYILRRYNRHLWCRPVTRAANRMCVYLVFPRIGDCAAVARTRAAPGLGVFQFTFKPPQTAPTWCSSLDKVTDLAVTTVWKFPASRHVSDPRLRQ